MKLIKRYYEEDLRKMIIKQLGVKPHQVLCIHSEECKGYGLGEHMEPVFYIQVEENAEENEN